MLLSVIFFKVFEQRFRRLVMELAHFFPAFHEFLVPGARWLLKSPKEKHQTIKPSLAKLPVYVSSSAYAITPHSPNKSLTPDPWKVRLPDST